MLLIRLILVEEGRSFVPADEALLLNIKPDALDPFADALELVVIPIDAVALGLDQSNGYRIALRVQQDGLSRWVRVMDVELDNEAALLPSRY